MPRGREHDKRPAAEREKLGDVRKKVNLVHSNIICFTSFKQVREFITILSAHTICMAVAYCIRVRVQLTIPAVIGVVASSTYALRMVCRVVSGTNAALCCYVDKSWRAICKL